MNVADRFRKEHCSTCPVIRSCDQSKVDLASCASMLTYFNLKRTKYTAMNVYQITGVCILIMCMNFITIYKLPIPLFILGVIGGIVGIALAVFYSEPIRR